MMRWNKIKIAAALVYGIALVGVGSGWLARGRDAALAAKKEPLPQKAPDPAEKIKNAIKKIHAEMDYLAEKENGEEEKLAAREIEARLRLLDAQNELRSQEQARNLEREDEQTLIKAAAQELALREKDLQRSVKMMDPKSAHYKDQMDRVSDAKFDAQRKLNDQRNRFLQHENASKSALREWHKRVFQAESELRRLESHLARVREVSVMKHRALLARLEQLERQSLGLEPADRLRDMERKLDSLRREVGELRRALERKNPE